MSFIMCNLWNENSPCTSIFFNVNYDINQTINAAISILWFGKQSIDIANCNDGK